MTKIILILTLFTPAMAWSDCPTPLQYEGDHYCLDIQWQNAERKVQGQFQESSKLSPVLVPMGEIPQRWLYSQALMQIWRADDAEQTPVVLENFRVFPFMHMANGHNHSTAHEWTFDPETGVYVLRALAFVQMRGCWTLRWTTSEQNSMDGSERLLSLTDFTNLTEQGVAEQQSFCETLVNSEGHHHHHHH